MSSATSSDLTRDHALVIGGSLAGLLAARVLSDHFDRVTIVERDAVHDWPETRKGQPQTRQFHGLLAAGLNLLTDYFPGLDDDLVKGGAIVRDMGEAMRWYHFGGYRRQHEAGLRGMLVSRPFLEWHVRRRVLALPNVTLRDGCAVEGLVAAPDGQRVTGAIVGGCTDGSQSETVPAALTVDASGRGSRAPAWLERLGYAPPPEEEVTVRVGYATRYYRRSPDAPGSDELVMTLPTPPDEKRMAVLSPVEGDRWVATAGGWAGDYPPGDEPGFLAFLESLPVPDVHEIVRGAEPLSDTVVHRFPSNRRRRYEKVRRFPEGFLVLGDALASFNPIYGQGMTSAAMQARVLDDVLRGPTTPSLWRRYFRAAARVVDRPWQLAVGEDFRYPETEGKKPPFVDLLNAYVARVHRATHRDPVVYGAFLRVMNLLAPPTSLMHPRILWRVLRSS